VLFAPSTFRVSGNRKLSRKDFVSKLRDRNGELSSKTTDSRLTKPAGAFLARKRALRLKWEGQIELCHFCDD